MNEHNRTRSREKAIAVGLILPDVPVMVAEEHLDELCGLIEAAGGEAAASVTQDRRAPDAATWIGKGKAEEVQRLVEKHDAGLVVFDDDLSPAQVRNLEKIIATKVLDRSALILDIFARRARTREARTQVELAQLQYYLPRLTRQWTHLSRQAGGIGTRGVGETQLEIDRRMIRTRIAKLREELRRLDRTRETQRRGRKRAFTVALVGYTNAGKSTLFNRLTSGGAMTADQLFATLDARLQKTIEPMPRETIIIDTVGFVRKLPHHLVASFRSTMSEAATADLVLHVIDASHPRFEEQRSVGSEVLRDLGIPAQRVIEVRNKIDRFEREPTRQGDEIEISAATGAGTARLLDAIRARQAGAGEVLHLRIPQSDARTIAALYEVGQVQTRNEDDGHSEFVAWVPHDRTHQFRSYAASSEGKS